MTVGRFLPRASLLKPPMAARSSALDGCSAPALAARSPACPGLPGLLGAHVLICSDYTLLVELEFAYRCALPSCLRRGRASNGSQQRAQLIIRACAAACVESPHDALLPLLTSFHRMHGLPLCQWCLSMHWTLLRCWSPLGRRRRREVLLQLERAALPSALPLLYVLQIVCVPS